MLASEVMDQALIFLNDSGQSLYTYTVQLPYLKRASEVLEQILAVHGVQVQRIVSSAISVTAGSTTLTLPSDFFIPISLRERNVGENDNQWVDMTEMTFEPIIEPISYIEYWSFRDNKVKLKECSVAKEVELRYIRTLGAFTSSASTVDISASKNYLAAKTAELCARYIGMNDAFADKIVLRDLMPSEDNLIRTYVLEGQTASRARRIGFSTKRMRAN